MGRFAVLKWLAAALQLVVATAQSASPHPADYLAATLRSLECLRDKRGLVQDKARLTKSPDACPLEITYAPTSPTNIALDLLIQLELHHSTQLAKSLRTLESLDYHRASGLFFARYSSGRVDDFYVSAIDNAHLALSLWVISHRAPSSPASALAAKIFRRMRFDPLYDRETGLFHGGMSFRGGANWVLDSWEFKYFGSESRTLYALAYALRLLDDPEFLDKFFRSSSGEIFAWKGRPLLGLWDGGAFQLLLPRLLLHEELYSRRFAEFYRSYVEYAIAGGQRRALPLPALHSACEYADGYRGKVGTEFLVSRQNQDRFDSERHAEWEAVLSPHALWLAWAVAPELVNPYLERAERLGLGEEKLYHRGMGWMDALYVKTERAGQVVPSVLALDQEMIALSLLEGRSDDSLNVSARTLFADPVVRERLMQFYSAADTWLDGL